MQEQLDKMLIGRWRSILPQVGVDPKYLTDNHGPCPMCGGKDRFRWDNKEGRGSYYCNQCGAGSGVTLVMKVNGWDFREARRALLKLIPTSRVEVPKTDTRPADPSRWSGKWQAAQKLMGNDPASLYLRNRGIDMGRNWPTQIRYMPSCVYWHDGEGDRRKTMHPAMIAQFVAPDARSATYHLTYLTEEGGKADLPKVRKMVPGPVPKGGAVRLAASGPVLGIAEGIETALAAAKMHDLPVWATLSAGQMVKVEIPDNVDTILIFGDRDRNFAGDHAAYSLAYRLVTEGRKVEVRLPDDYGDWNDVWQRVQARQLQAAE